MLEIRVLPSPSGTANVVKVAGRLDRFRAATFARGLAALPGPIRLDCSDLDGIDMRPANTRNRLFQCTPHRRSPTAATQCARSCSTRSMPLGRAAWM